MEYVEGHKNDGIVHSNITKKTAKCTRCIKIIKCLHKGQFDKNRVKKHVDGVKHQRKRKEAPTEDLTVIVKRARTAATR